MGAQAHPRPTEAEENRVQSCIAVARAVCRLAAKLLPQWPKLKLDGVELRAEHPERPLGLPVQGHVWQHCSGMWRCT
eukprot:817056-Pyramimonas_sp.AAC.1